METKENKTNNNIFIQTLDNFDWLIYFFQIIKDLLTPGANAPLENPFWEEVTLTSYLVRPFHK